MSLLLNIPLGGFIILLQPTLHCTAQSAGLQVSTYFAFSIWSVFGYPGTTWALPGSWDRLWDRLGHWDKLRNRNGIISSRHSAQSDCRLPSLAKNSLFYLLKSHNVIWTLLVTDLFSVADRDVILSFRKILQFQAGRAEPPNLSSWRKFQSSRNVLYWKAFSNVCVCSDLT